MERSCDSGRRQVDEDEFYMIENWDESLHERPTHLNLRNKQCDI